jgi:transposase InsO family protein
MQPRFSTGMLLAF